jgi:hypothetical protein
MSEGHTFNTTKRGVPIVLAGYEVEGLKPVDYGGRAVLTHGLMTDGQDVGVIHIGEQANFRHFKRICKCGHQF